VDDSIKLQQLAQDGYRTFFEQFQLSFRKLLEHRSHDELGAANRVLLVAVLQRERDVRWCNTRFRSFLDVVDSIVGSNALNWHTPPREYELAALLGLESSMEAIQMLNDGYPEEALDEHFASAFEFSRYSLKMFKFWVACELVPDSTANTFMFGHKEGRSSIGKKAVSGRADRAKQQELWKEKILPKLKDGLAKGKRRFGEWPSRMAAANWFVSEFDPDHQILNETNGSKTVDRWIKEYLRSPD
jgi:hypothetical protein